MPGTQEKKRDRGSENDPNSGPLALMQSKYLRLGDREVERHQTVVGFAVSKSHRLECQIHFNFCGSEKERITEALELFRLGISKLRLVGTLLLRDELFGWLLGNYPLLRSIKFELSDPLCNQLTEEGFSAAMNKSGTLWKLHMNHLQVPCLSIASNQLQMLTLRQMTKCETVDLNCPRLSSLELDYSPLMQRVNPLKGLGASLAPCAASGALTWLCVTYPFGGIEEYDFLKTLDGKLSNLGIRLADVDVLAVVPNLSVLELFCVNSPDLGKLSRWKNLKVLKLHGHHCNLQQFLHETTSVTSLLVENYPESELVLQSESLEAVQVHHCPELVVLDVNAPKVSMSSVQNCPKLVVRSI
jgi:hypothetical protein